MTVDPSKSREQRLFEAALRLEAGPERQAFLQAVCTSDPELRQRLEQLLSAASEADVFFQNDPLVQAGVIQKTSLPPAKATPVTQSAGQRIGRYKLLQQIGEGGLGVVYMAEQEEPVRRRVALKIIKPGMDTQSVIARFEAERQALALMDHPNIAKILDGGVTEDSRPFFVMDLVQGLPVTQFCDDARLTTIQRLALFVEICGAVQHAHQKGIIHRDLKPSNILVTLHGDKPMPKIIDFGIAKATQQRLTDKTLFTQFQHFIGTPAYMSPEQASLSGLDIDTRSDIYSLGVLLYELLTGKTPFDAKELLQAGLDEMRRTIREKEPERPSTKVSTLAGDELTTTAKRRGLEPPKLVSTLRGDLDWIVMKCLEKARGRRYETANGLAMDIQRHLNNEPVVACPPSQLYRVKKAVQRNKLLMAAGGSVLAALVFGLCTATWGLLRERAGRRVALAAGREQSRLRQQAETEARKSRQVAQLLKDMLEGAGPEVAAGRDATILLEILNKTAERISTELTNQPAVESDFRNTLGKLYFELGQYSKAEPILRRALELERQMGGDAPRAVGETVGYLGEVAYSQGKFAVAEEYFQQALADFTRRNGGRENREVAVSLSNIAAARIAQGKLAEAKAAAEESLALERKLFGDHDESVAGTLEQLADLNRHQGNYNDAEAEFREALSIARTIWTNDDPRLEVAINNLALTAKDQRKFAEAETLSREALAMDRRLLGNSHPDVLINLNNVSSILMAENKLAEAEAVSREALAIIRKSPVGLETVLPQTLQSLSSALRLQHKYAEAEPLAREALAAARKRFGDRNERVAVVASNLASILTAQGSYDESERLYNELLSITNLSPTTRALLLPQRGAFLARRGRWQAARTDLAAALALRANDRAVWHLLAAVLLQLSEAPAYHEHCRNAIAQFAHSSDPATTLLIARDALVLPVTGADLEQVAALVRNCPADRTNGTVELAPAYPLLELRQQHWQAALDASRKYLDSIVAGTTNAPVTSAARQVQTQAVLALAQFRLGQSAAAGKALSDAGTLANTSLPPPDAADLGEDWAECIMARTLLSEAKGVLGDLKQ